MGHPTREKGVPVMTDVPMGKTGERCKEDGTYACNCGATRYYDQDEPFEHCPRTGRETFWKRVR